MIQGRIVELMSHFKVTALELANNIGVQPSSVSHILSGRNKPSLDFVNKLLDKYPQVNFDWLVNGRGNMLKSSGEEESGLNLFSFAGASEDLSSSEEEKAEQIAEHNPQKQPTRSRKSKAKESLSVSQNDYLPPNQSQSKQISRIMVFYTDNTFEEFTPCKREN